MILEFLYILKEITLFSFFFFPSPKHFALVLKIRLAALASAWEPKLESVMWSLEEEN